MAAKLRVKVSDRENGTTTIDDVEMVGVAVRAGLGSEIEVRSRKHATDEVSAKKGMSVG